MNETEIEEKLKKAKEAQQLKIIFFLTTIQTMLFYILNTTINKINIELEETVTKLEKLGFIFHETASFTVVLVSITSCILLNTYITDDKRKYFKEKKAQIMIFIMSLILTSVISFLGKDVKIQETMDFIKTTEEPIDKSHYEGLLKTLEELKMNKEKINNKELNEQYEEILKTTKDINYPIKRVEETILLKNIEKFYKIYNELKVKKDYEQIKNFK